MKCENHANCYVQMPAEDNRIVKYNTVKNL